MTQVSKYPVLRKIAFDILAIPASSVPSERGFFKAGIVISDLRNRRSAVFARVSLCLITWYSWKSFHFDKWGAVESDLWSAICRNLRYGTTYQYSTAQRATQPTHFLQYAEKNAAMTTASFFSKDPMINITVKQLSISWNQMVFGLLGVVLKIFPNQKNQGFTNHDLSNWFGQKTEPLTKPDHMVKPLATLLTIVATRVPSNGKRGPQVPK